MYYKKHRSSAFWRVFFVFCLSVGIFWVMKNPDIFTKQFESVGAGRGQVLGAFFEQLGESAREQAKRVGERVVALKARNSKFQIPNSKVKFRFAVVADSHEDEIYFPRILERIKQENVDFIVHLGDLVNSGDLEKFKKAKDFLDNSGIAYYVIPGDHDYNWQPTHSLANFKEVFAAEQIYTSFEHKGVFLIFFDNSDNSKEVDVVQIKWLREQLELKSRPKANQPLAEAINNKQSTINNLFIFSHKPFFNPYFLDKTDPNGVEILMLLKEFNIDQVFSGNVHIFARYSDNQTGIGITTIGAAGTSKNPLPQYALVTVYKDASFDVEAKPYKELKLAE